MVRPEDTGHDPQEYRADERIKVVPMDGARISIAVDCRIGGDNADFIVARRCQRGFRAGGNYVQHRHIARLLTDFLPPTAAIVLHAITIALTSCSSRKSTICMEKYSMVAFDFVP